MLMIGGNGCKWLLGIVMNRIDHVKRWLSMYDDSLCRRLSLKVLITGSDGGNEV